MINNEIKHNIGFIIKIDFGVLHNATIDPIINNENNNQIDI